MGIAEQAGAVGSAAVGAMQSQPLAIALLIVNCAFLGFAGYVLGEVSENAKARNVTQMDLISKLVGDIRDCRQGSKSNWLSLPKVPLTIPIHGEPPP